MRGANQPERFRREYIDGLRALAVLAVVVGHVRVGEALMLEHWLPGIEYIGARGVDLFFVVSGFCLSYPYLYRVRSTGRLSIDYGIFMSRRFARIAPPYYIAMFCFTLLSLTEFGFPTTWAPLGKSVDIATGLHQVFPNLAFLTTRDTASNGAFWTLGIEMRWYLLCPFLIALFVRSRTFFG